MSFLSDRKARRFFTVVAVAGGAFLLLALLLSALHASALRAVLLERERTLSAALLEQAVPPAVIAGALQSGQSSAAAETLLRRLGRTARTPFWLLAPVRARTASFLLAACAGTLLLSACQLAAAGRYLAGRDRLYGEAAARMACFAGGDFSRHLPRDEAGALYRLFAAAEQLSAVLQSKIDAGQRSREFLKETLSDISHQLKTPLAALQMYVDIIAAEPGCRETVCAFTEKSQAAITRMENLIAALLKIARLDAGGIPFAPETVRAADLAASAAAELQTRARREGKRLALSGDPSLSLRCDPAWTAEALGNLIKNALDHTGPGDAVTVRWERSPALCRILVEDTGEGIAPADLHHIFKRFYRGPSAKAGVGLGLPLARALVEGQGGVLTVQSEPRKGSVFAISFLEM